MIREGLRLLDERIKKIDAINKALIIGEESGKAQDYNYSAFIKNMAKKHKAKYSVLKGDCRISRSKVY